MTALLELWESFQRAITVYTGLSPVTFLTAVAVAAVIYHFVANFLAPVPPPRDRGFVPQEEQEPLPPPVQLGEITEDDLKAYDGSDRKKPLLMAIKGQIYDVTQSRMFYGPGGPYALFAGKDASRALAKMSFEEQDLTSDVAGLGPFELDALQDWEYKFMTKYIKVGTIKKPDLVENADVSPNVVAENADVVEKACVAEEVAHEVAKEVKKENEAEVAKEE